MRQWFWHKSSVPRYILLDGVSPGEYVFTEAIVLPKLWGRKTTGNPPDK